MKRLITLLVMLAGIAAAEIPPFVLIGSEQVLSSANTYEVTTTSGSQLTWRQTGIGGYTDGKRVFTPTPNGWNQRGEGEVFTRASYGWSIRGGRQIFKSALGYRYGSSEYRITSTGALLEQ